MSTDSRFPASDPRRSAVVTGSWWVLLAVLLAALLNLAGALIALIHPGMLVSPLDQITKAVHVYAGYLVSRDLAIAGSLLVMLITGNRRALGVLMLLAGSVQLLDAVMDCVEARWMVAPGVLLLGVFFGIAGFRLHSENRPGRSPLQTT